MLRLMNLTDTDCDLERYQSADDLRGFLKSHALHGIELLPFMGESSGIIPPESVLGLHMSYFPCWVDYWQGDSAAVLREFESLEQADANYHGGRRGMLDRFAEQLEQADRLNARYVVFHVSDVSIEESVTYRFRHTDAQVIEASLDLINKLLKGKRYSFEFLVENLWWPGFTMIDPAATGALLNGIKYPHKGIMLDIGHLMHTNTALRTQEEGAAYILKMLDAHGALASAVRGVHLHQSLSGAFVEAMIGDPPALSGGYYDRLGQAYTQILKIDRHRPMTTPAVRALIDRIAPEYLTYEFITESRAQHAEFIDQQNLALYGDTFHD